MQKITGKLFVTGDNIDTDQIIPAQYLNLVPTNPDELAKLGSHALAGLPDKFGRFIPEGQAKSPYAIIIGGRNFGCGSSREHAPISLGAAGGKVVVAESFARIFFRNCIATGQLYPVESEVRLCDELRTGMDAEVDLEAGTLSVPALGKSYRLRPLGAAKDVIDNGGLFEHARKSGMLK
ncbi:MAG: 3-isopropylmalate dehydratase [Lentisphaeria bacterium]|jgi:3-isopropylmalate/(R)-2-methylmalate dehydratase small subunit